ncbi:MAG: hypothetical protein H6625_13000 [Bdellovibrionaceae bacterium]|nr:hypothetical protein [Pseudobdellovibrionaceae bacterium]
MAKYTIFDVLQLSNTTFGSSKIRAQPSKKSKSFVVGLEPNRKSGIRFRKPRGFTFIKSTAYLEDV